MAVIGVLCTGVALGFGVSERLQQRELLWRWLLDRSERTVDDVAYRIGELWLKQLRLNANSADHAVLEGRIRIEREHLEHLGRTMIDDEPAPEANPESLGPEGREECNLYSDRWERLRAVDPYLLANLRSAGGGGETQVIFVNCTESEIAYYWIDRDGVEHYYGRIAPGSDTIQHSYEGHVWVAKDGNGAILSVFRAALTRSLAFVTPERPVDNRPASP